MANEKDCQKAQEQLSEYLDQRLPAQNMRMLETHLYTCVNCQKKWEELKRIRAWLKDTPTYKPPESFYTQVMRKIEKTPKAQTLLSGYRWKALATACVLIITIFVVRDSGKFMNQASKPAMNEVVHLEKQSRLEKGRADKPRLLFDRETEKKKDAGREQFQYDIVSNFRQPSVEDSFGSLERRVVHRTARDRVDPLRLNEPVDSRGRFKVGRKASPTKLKKAEVPEPIVQKSISEPTPGQRPLRASQTTPKSSASSITEQVVISAGKSVPQEIEEVIMEQEDSKQDNQKYLDSLDEKGSQWKGQRSSIHQFKTVIIESEPGWVKLWEEHSGSLQADPQTRSFAKEPQAASTTPTINFENFQVVAIFAGEKPTGGYSIEIISVQKISDKLIIQYKERAPSPNLMVIQILTQPFHIMTIPKTNLPISFQKIP